MDNKQSIIECCTSLGIELGSTRIKAVLIDNNFNCIATGGYDWENKLEEMPCGKAGILKIWTYNLDDVWKGLQECYKNLVLDVKNRYGVELTSVGSIGISAMMHGYLVFDKNDNLLVPFRTWRNTITEQSAIKLTETFQFNIPQRWSITHLYQSILNEEPHLNDIGFITTLAGFVHWKLTGKKVAGVGDASGMFPISDNTINYNTTMINQFNEIISPYGFGWKILDILPEVLNAGEAAGVLTQEGSALLDPTGFLKAGIPFCPPEGDAGTGMVATNSIAQRTGNVSAGTSIFAMIVMEKGLSKVYPEIDIVTTPTGKPVSMVHCNNCTTDIDAWVKLFGEFAEATGIKIDKTELYTSLYNKALNADADCGKLFSCNYYSGEHITGLKEGRPLFVRFPDSNFTLANFMRTLLFSSFGTLKYGIDILVENEKIRIDNLMGHGGLFKTKGVGQRFMAAVFNSPVSVMEDSAAEGGAWGIALLAAFLQFKEKSSISLEQFLAEKVFAGKKETRIEPCINDVNSFKMFMKLYSAGLNIERSAVEHF
jgi:sugar (pentulose or hexulose) kinase